MVDRKVMAFALATVMVVAQLQSRFIRIEDETFNRQSLQTGEVLTLSGAFVSLIDSDMRAWSSIFSESTNAGNRWEILARDPPGNVFDIPGNDVVDYEISARALEPGVYHVHTQLNIEHVGPGLGPNHHCSWLCNHICNTTLASNLNSLFFPFILH